MYFRSQEEYRNAQSPRRRKWGFEDGKGKPKYQVLEREPLKTFVCFKCSDGAITPREEMIHLAVPFL